MSHGPKAPRARLERAGRYIDQLKMVVKEWKDLGDAYDLIFKSEDDANIRMDYWLKVNHFPPVDEMSFIAGDFIHAVRASLDNLIWQLGLRYPVPKKVRRGLHFPICLSVEQYARETEMLHTFPRPAQVVIERFQPYHRPDRPALAPLAILNKFWNDDKHRAPNVVYASLIGSHVTPADDVPLEVHFEPTRINRDGETYLGYILMLNENVKTTIEAKFAIDVTFDEAGPAGGRQVDVVLSELYDAVANEVFPALEPFL